MSFWKKAADFAAETAMKAINEGQKFVTDSSQYEMEYQNYSDEKLTKIFKSSAAYSKRAAAAKVLQSRRGSEQT